MFWCYFYPNIPTKTRQATYFPNGETSHDSVKLGDMQEQ